MVEVYLYSPIYDFVAEEVMKQLDANKNKEITMRLNTPGGSVFAGWGIISKMKECSNLTVAVDGQASSMGLFACLFAKKVCALDVSNFTLHRADGYVDTEEDQILLDNINSSLKAAFQKKINENAFKVMKCNPNGYTIKDIFDPKRRIELNLTAEDAKFIGLVSEVNVLTPEAHKAVSMRFAAYSAKTTNIPEPIIKNNKMTKEELKAKHPDVYAEIISEERDRVEACLTFIEIDPVGVKAAIESGKPLTHKQMSEFAMKQFNAEALKKIEGGNPPVIVTGAVQQNAGTPEAKKQEEVERFLAEARKDYINLNKKG